MIKLRTAYRLLFFLLIALHLGLILVGIFQGDNYMAKLLIFTLVLLPTTVFYLYRAKAPNRLGYEKVTGLWIVIAASIITYYLNNDLLLGPTLAASSVALFASVFQFFFKNSKRYKIYINAVYCGAFVGMSSTMIVHNYVELLIASVVTGFIYIGTKYHLTGVGGKYGSIAFGGVAAAFFIFNLIR